MEEKKGFSAKLEAFFAGKGFYIVLLLSAAVIGTSIWLMVAGSRANVEETDGEPQEILNAEASITSPEPEEQTMEMETENAEEPAAVMPEEPTVEQEPLAADEGEEPETEQVWSESDASEMTLQAEYFIWPVNGTVERAYCVETLSYDRTLGDWRTHDGLDIAAELGTQVMAAGAGTVTAVYTDDLYGTTVEIDHGAGLVSVYSNLAAMPTVMTGDHVTAGQVIGAVGDTALCEVGEVYHLHFAMRCNGASVNPEDWLPAK